MTTKEGRGTRKQKDKFPIQGQEKEGSREKINTASIKKKRNR